MSSQRRKALMISLNKIWLVISQEFNKLVKKKNKSLLEVRLHRKSFRNCTEIKISK
jgi:hypothetical protein